MHRSAPHPLRRTVRVAVLLGITAIPTAAFGHGQPISLAFWGGYSPSVARCQRAIARASAQCLGDVITTRQACLTPVLGGVPCDTQALTATIAALRQRALEHVVPSCTSLQLQQLLYADLSDAYRDIIDACRRLDTALSTAVYLPARASGAVQPVDAPTRACIEAAADASAKLFAFAVRARQQALDRIAGTRLAPSEKQGLVNRANERIARALARLRVQISRRCAPDDFMAAYHREAGTFLQDVADQSACHSQYVYVQDAVLCPAVVCGNGIEEPTEECDDANDREDDGCRSDCTVGTCTTCVP